jgi:hypothetical protein
LEDDHMTDMLSTTDRPAAVNPAWPPDDADLLERVDRLLQEDRPQEALSLLPDSYAPWIRNARGVCLLRLGRQRQAIETLRDLVFNPDGFGIRHDADPVFQANYATALLLDGNTDGFFSILAGIRERSHPAVVRLKDAIRRWRAGMTFGQRVRSVLGIGGPPFALDFPPGEL